MKQLVQVEVLGIFVEEPLGSLHILQREVLMSRDKIRKAITLNKFHPKKIQIPQQLLFVLFLKN